MIRRLAETDDPSGFSCGNLDLDRYLTSHALWNAELGVGVTHVEASADGRIVGYITLAGAVVSVHDVPNIRTQRPFPRYPLPALLVARLAVDQRHQGHGVGTKLLGLAFEEASALYERFGCVGVAVDSKVSAIGFYERAGFEPTQASAPVDGSIRMFLGIGAILDALG